MMMKVWSWSALAIIVLNFAVIEIGHLDKILGLGFLLPALLTFIRQYILTKYAISSLSVVFLSEAVKLAIVSAVLFLVYYSVSKENILYSVAFCVNFLVASGVEYFAFSMKQ